MEVGSTPLRNSWEWEDFDRQFTANRFRITDADSLLLPIASFAIIRDDKRQLVMSTVALGEVTSQTLEAPAGTVSPATDTITFAGHPPFPGLSAVGRGVIPRNHSETYNQNGVKETHQEALISSLDIQLKPELEPAFTIDWLENLDTKHMIWSGSAYSYESENNQRFTVGSGDAAITLTGKLTDAHISSHSVLGLTVGGIQLYIYGAVAGDGDGAKRGCILYRGAPEEKIRWRVREVLAFCLGNYLIYLGCSRFADNSDLVSLTVESAHGVGVRAFDTFALPPAPLGRRYDREVDASNLEAMSNAIFDHYDELDFTELSWSYWHAAIAPSDMAAAYYGGALEALRRSLKAARPSQFRTMVVEEGEVWASVEQDLLKVIAEASLTDEQKTMLGNKIRSNLNQLPQSQVTLAFAEGLGLRISSLEQRAWSNRNRSAHGSALKADHGDTIRETKILKMLLHRIVFKASNASNRYRDYYTLHFPVRNVDDPII
jgi:hypothetical protein